MRIHKRLELESVPLALAGTDDELVLADNGYTFYFLDPPGQYQAPGAGPLPQRV